MASPPHASVSLFEKEVCRLAWGGAARTRGAVREADTMRTHSDCLEKAVLSSGSSVDSCWRGKFLEPPTVVA